ncbi:RNA 2'-phosphotransferase [Halosimplex carlsbadense 2-9-1]|uniref:Probable RNA 2'-phosphotransferase n=1 Tax=Halosimplex carlsbadense 2-9-1 TaxID=797114 RepID=M0CWH8_9EURY|nr:RNA 2'-phosphotransferase [Halosimplex carlsbadense]ELZ27581.1 RNA 2'-phosphotransferase [Halosimplex carlsbadense 2-9-1]
MTDVRTCDDHGYFEAEGCPVCDGAGRPVLDGERRRRLSKYLSGALRHFPDDAGLALDGAGWTAFDDLVAAAERQYGWADREAVAAVVATDPNGRFERTGGSRAGGGTDRAEPGGSAGDWPDDRVRAAYGHSVDVDLDSNDGPVPDTLYHGTAPDNVDAIRAEGLKPMSRQLVHLSGTVAEARRVGARHAADPVLFDVDAARMAAEGREITRRGRATYTTERVPPAFLSLLSE